MTRADHHSSGRRALGTGDRDGNVGTQLNINLATATAVLTYHRTEDPLAFQEFAERLGATAEGRPQFKVWQHSVLTSADLDWAIAITFYAESALHDWLDHIGDHMDEDLHRHSRLDLITGGAPRTEGVLLVREAVKPDREADYLLAAGRLVRLERSQPGYDGSSVFPAFEGKDGTEPWSRVVRFRTAKHLTAWLDSPMRHSTLPELEQHLSEDAPVSATTAFSTLRVSQDGETLVTPPWKTYMMVLLVLYPTAILQARFVDPVIRGLVPVPWVAALMSMMVNVALLVWVMMPLGSRLLRRWMDPVDGAGTKVTLLGIVAILVSFAVYLPVFLALGFLPVG